MSIRFGFTAVFLLCFICSLAEHATIVFNAAGRSIQLYWVDVISSGNLRDQSGGPMMNGSEIQFNAQSSHQFVARFSPHVEGTEVLFTKGSREETFTIVFNAINRKLEAMRGTKLDVFLDEIILANRRCSTAGLAQNSCIESSLPEADRFVAKQDHLVSQNKVMAKRLRELMCKDTSMTSSKPIQSVSRLVSGKNITFDMLLDTRHAKIWTVDNFISREECELFHNAVKDHYVAATVYAPNGSAVVNSVRKASVAGYPMSGGASDPLWPLYNRVIAVVNLRTGMRLGPAGQEGFGVIHYDPSEQYLSHCDTRCEGQPHLRRGRVATAVLYCRVPEVGGATTFTKADVFVKPKAGMATFFTYKGSDGRMDDGLTEHSGCPVVVGEKMIATAWLREGVDESDLLKRYDVVGRLTDNN